MSASLVQLALYKVEEHLGGVLCSTQPPGVTDGIHDHVSSRENPQRLQGGKESTWEIPQLLSPGWGQGPCFILQLGLPTWGVPTVLLLMSTCKPASLGPVFPEPWEQRLPTA